MGAIVAAQMLVGPVIGKVTATSARILIEASQACQITAVATAPGVTPTTVQASLIAGSPSIVRLDNLQPDTKYTVQFGGIASPVPCSFRTYPTAPHRLNVGVVSCNFASRRGTTDLWKDLFDRYVNQGDLGLLLHVGDQVYGDTAFAEAEHLLGTASKPTKAQRSKIIALYRQLYRWNWGHPSTRVVLANVPNLMIWDDHEIRDDWGSLPDDSLAGSRAQHIGRLARQVFREYQRQLWDDLQDPAPGELEDHYHAWGPIGVVFLDQRGGRSFHPDAARPYLGSAQWDRLRTALSTGVLKDARVLIVVTSVPLCYLGAGIGNALVFRGDDRADHWSHSPNRQEQVELIRLLRQWKDQGDRELLVVGGDVHVGCKTDIKHQDKTIFKQLITSPITNKPPHDIAFLFMKAALELDQRISDSYSFEHYDYTNERNFGIVLVRVPQTGVPHVEGSLFSA